MKICDYEQRPDRLICRTMEREGEYGVMELIPMSCCILRIRVTLDAAFPEKISESVIARADLDAFWQLRHDEINNILIYHSEKAMVRIVLETAKITYFYKNMLMLEDADSESKVLERCRIQVPEYPDKITPSNHRSSDEHAFRNGIDGLESNARTNAVVTGEASAYHTRLNLVFDREESIYGLGQHEEAILDYRGKEQYLFQHNLKIAIPFLVSSKGYGLLFDHCSASIFRDNQHGTYFWSDAERYLDYYYIAGGSIDGAVRGMRFLTGKATLLPRWAFGYIQSKEHYHTQDELLSTAQEYRKRRIPLDGIVQDWLSWDLNQWGNKAFDPTRYPDPEGMIERLHAMNVRYMHSIWPSMKEGGENHAEMKGINGFYANNYTYNPYKESTRRLYWEQLHRGLFLHGVDAWWCDCTEPFKYDWGLKHRPDIVENYTRTVEEFRRNIDPRMINAYSLVHAKGIYEGQMATSQEKRVFNLIRSSYPGQQRYGTVAWSGDICARWDVLESSIASGLNFCMSGLPYWTLDIGAFFVKNNPNFWSISGDYEQGCNDLGYRELYVRWLQYATFLPVMRSHGTDTPREVWQFGKKGEMFYDAIVQSIQWRYRLLPTTYSLAGLTWLNDDTMYRAMVFDFPGDPLCRDLRTQFMFGRSLMVCPVTRPMHYLQNSRPMERGDCRMKVYLPEGTRWHAFPEGEVYEGGQHIDVDAPMDRIPLFAPSGGILILGPTVLHTEEKKDATWDLYLYTGRNGSFTVYEDEGDGTRYEKGFYVTYQIRYFEEDNTLLFHDFHNGLLREYHRKFNLYVDGRLAMRGIMFDGKDLKITVPSPVSDGVGAQAMNRTKGES
jgi:alpha-D-xyloside xylohydrolase